jgi:hypothetical protein
MPRLGVITKCILLHEIGRVEVNCHRNGIGDLDHALLLQQFLNPLDGFLPVHVLVDGQAFEDGDRLCLHNELSDAPDGEMFADRGLPSPIASMNRRVVLRSCRAVLSL